MTSPHQESIIAWFDARAEDGTAAAQEERFSNVAERVIAAMEVRPGQQLVDLGCGAGWATKLLGKKAPGAQAIGFDISKATIAKADAETDWTSRARFECSSFESLDAPDARFDHALSLDALEYAESPADALSEIARVVKPGGRLELVLRRFAESPATENFAASIGVELPFHATADWEALLDAAGFDVDASERLHDTLDVVPFTATPLVNDESAHVAEVEAGVQWIRAIRRA